MGLQIGLLDVLGVVAVIGGLLGLAQSLGHGRHELGYIAVIAVGHNLQTRTLEGQPVAEGVVVDAVGLVGRALMLL